MARKRETNDEFVRRVMRFAKTGPMMQLFIIDALTKHSDHVAKASDAEIDAAFGNTLINGYAWREAARELKAELDTHYGPKSG